jgi:hypothetical protein
MPDGGTVLCRFYDSRCLAGFLQFFADKHKNLCRELQKIAYWAYWKDETYVVVNSAGIVES